MARKAYIAVNLKPPSFAATRDVVVSRTMSLLDAFTAVKSPWRLWYSARGASCLMSSDSATLGRWLLGDMNMNQDVLYCCDNIVLADTILAPERRYTDKSL